MLGLQKTLGLILINNSWQNGCAMFSVGLNKRTDPRTKKARRSGLFLSRSLS
jgi:hypothetical protein